MSGQRALSHQSKIYHQFSHFYEAIFTRFFRQRIQSTVQSLNIPPGAKVLEVGVGTGLSLTAYPEHCQLVGIDLAAEMLAQADRKVQQHGWNHVQLQQMDALNLEFPDEHFDYVMAFHVISVVPDHERMLQEMTRVTKAGGTLLIINHFRSERRWLAPLIDLLDPVTRRLGWRTTIRFSDLMGPVPLHVQRRFKTSSRSLFTVVMATRPQAHGDQATRP